MTNAYCLFLSVLAERKKKKHNKLEPSLCKAEFCRTELLCGCCKGVFMYGCFYDSHSLISIFAATN